MGQKLVVIKVSQNALSFTCRLGAASLTATPVFDKVEMHD